MKIRTGFVSNSSSSSFICCGYRIKMNTEAHNKIKNNFDENRPFDIIDSGWDFIVGTRWGELDALEGHEFTKEEVVNVFDSSKVKAAKEFTQTDEEPKIFFVIEEY